MYVRAQWYLYDMVFYAVSRLETFRKIVALGIGRREAAEMIRDCERCPD
jgi:hypothetical protein